MDFTFSEQQLAFRDAMSRFLMTEAAPEMLREVWETDGGRSPALRAKLAGQGLTALSVPEAEGGLGLGDMDWALMTQELGYYAIPDSLADTAYVAAGLLADLPEGHPLRRDWLPRVADGSARLAVGHPVNPWVADAHRGTGAWLGFDVTNNRLAGPELCRLAVGRDFMDAGPIRGMRIGGVDEEMQVRVAVAGQ